MSKNNLEIQFDNITPDVLKESETIRVLLELYMSSFTELETAIDDPLELLDSDYLISRFKETENGRFDDIRKELFKIHLQEIYAAFEDIGSSEEIYNKFKNVYESLDIPTNDLKIVADIDESINSEYINAARTFKSKKGTKSGFFFVNDIINRAGLQSKTNEQFFEIVETKIRGHQVPYEYSVETSLYKEVFSKTVIPLAHPVGFNWHFVHLLFLVLEDRYGLELIEEAVEATLICYGESSIEETEIIESGIFGELKNFESTTDKNKNNGVIIDYHPLDGSLGDGIRLVRDFDGHVVIYDRQREKHLRNEEGFLTGEIQYLEIEEVRLPNAQKGKLSWNTETKTILGETFEVISNITFEEYTIIDNDFIEIEYRLRGDLPNKWNTTKLPLDNKVVSFSILLFEGITFYRTDILDHSYSYNGRVIEDKGFSCMLNYTSQPTYRVSTRDISDYVKNKRPINANRVIDTKDIIKDPEGLLNSSDFDDDGEYGGLYSNTDHTVEEINWYMTSDSWARNDYGSHLPFGYIGETHLDPTINYGHIEPEKKVDPVTGHITYIPDGEIIDLTIGGPYILSSNPLHKFDYGYNEVLNRWENSFMPDPQEDLDLIGKSHYPIWKYQQNNTEYFGNRWTHKNNEEYTAWEHFSFTVFFNMNSNEMLCGRNTFVKWEVGEADYRIGCHFVDGLGINLGPNLEPYRINWLDTLEMHSTTDDNVISSEYESYSMKVYRLVDSEWIYLEDNNITAAI